MTRVGGPRPDPRAQQVEIFAGTARTLGSRLRFLRESRRWTLEHAAARMSIDWKHLQRIETGKVNVTLASLVRIAWGFGLHVRELFVDPEDAGPLPTDERPDMTPGGLPAPTPGRPRRPRNRRGSMKKASASKVVSRDDGASTDDTRPAPFIESER